MHTTLIFSIFHNSLIYLIKTRIGLQTDFPETVIISNDAMLNVKIEFTMFTKDQGEIDNRQQCTNDSECKRTDINLSGDEASTINHSWPIRKVEDGVEVEEEQEGDKENKKKSSTNTCYSLKHAIYCKLSIEYHEYIFILPPRVRLGYREG